MLLWMSVFSFLALAAPTLDESLLQPFPKEPLLNEVVVFRALEGHKFNDQAENTCGNGRRLKVNEESVECQMRAPGTSELELYICDDKKTFCRREVISVTTQHPKGLMGWVKYYKDSWLAPHKFQAPNKQGLSVHPPVKGFEGLSSVQVGQKAKREKKPVLMYFTQLACAPCRLFKEVTLQSDEFQKATENYIRVQVDIDVENEPEFFKPLQVRGTPTLILFNKDLQEVDRRMLVMSPQDVQRWLESTPPISIQALAGKSSQKLTDEERLRLSRWYFTKGDLEKSEEWLKKVQTITEDTKVWADLLKVAALPPKDSWSILQQHQSSLGKVNDFTRQMFWETVNDKLYKVALSKNVSDWNQATKIVKSMALEGMDPVALSLEKVNRLMNLKYGSESYALKGEVKSYGQGLVAELDKLPIFVSEKSSSYVELMKAEAAQDYQKREQVAQKLLEENSQDYAYDFSVAKKYLRAGDKDKALIHAEKSLAIAKDRSWQKAFLLKMDVLMALKKDQEAQQEMTKVLKELELPTSTEMKVHDFVKEIREKQSLITKI